MFSSSILKRANTTGTVEYRIINLRDFTQDKHRVTDDRPFGGGPGMVMKVEPIDLALRKIRSESPKACTHRVVLLSAQGEKYTQGKAREFAALDMLTIICGHYEGVDERVALHLADEEIRIGEYVLTGGEPAAAVIADSVVRLLPGVLGNSCSTHDESHDVPGQLGYPQYTRPAIYNGWEVPAVLLSGDHKLIMKWRRTQRKKDS